MQVEKNITTEREHEIMEKVKLYYDLAVSGNSDLMNRMEKSQRYVCGDQWDHAVKNYNESRGKLCLTIPLIRPQIKQLVGTVIQNPKDITVLNYRGGEKVLADLQTALIMHAMKDESASFELVQMFDEGISNNSGYMGVFIERERDPYYGDLEIRKLDSFDVLPDPTIKVYDPNSRRDGAKFIIWMPWVDKEWLAKKWSDKAAQIGSYGSSGVFNSLVSHVKRLVGFISGSRLSSIASATSGRYESSEYYKIRDRLCHTWWIEYRPIYYFYDLREEKQEPLVVVESEEKQQAEQAVKDYKDVFKLEEVVAPVMNHTLTVGDVFLENRFDEFNLLKSGQTVFPIVPFYPYFNNGYKASVAEDMIGVQDFVNWTRSNIANLLKQQPSRGWIIEKDPTGTFETWLKQHGGEDNVVINKAKGGGQVEQLKQPAIQLGVVKLTEIGKNEIREVTNIRTEEPEKDAAKLSGIAIAQKKESSLTGVSPVLFNWDYTLHLLGNLLAIVIRGSDPPIYSLEEISKIVEEKNLLDSKLLNEARLVASKMMGIQMPEPFEFSITMLAALHPEDAEVMQQKLKQLDLQREAVYAKLDIIAKPIAIQAIVDAMRNLRAGRYQSTVSTSPSSSTFRTKQFAETIEIDNILIKLGKPPLPAKYLIEASDLLNKEKILADMGEQ